MTEDSTNLMIFNRTLLLLGVRGPRHWHVHQAHPARGPRHYCVRPPAHARPQGDGAAGAGARGRTDCEGAGADYTITADFYFYFEIELDCSHISFSCIVSLNTSLI